MASQQSTPAGSERFDQLVMNRFLLCFSQSPTAPHACLPSECSRILFFFKEFQLFGARKQVGNAFVQQFFLVLHKSPDQLHRFYKESSKLGRPGPKGEMSTTSSLQVIYAFLFRCFGRKECGKGRVLKPRSRVLISNCVASY